MVTKVGWTAFRRHATAPGDRAVARAGVIAPQKLIVGSLRAPAIPSVRRGGRNAANNGAHQANGDKKPPRNRAREFVHRPEADQKQLGKRERDQVPRRIGRIHNPRTPTIKRAPERPVRHASRQHNILPNEVHDPKSVELTNVATGSGPSTACWDEGPCATIHGTTCQRSEFLPSCGEGRVYGYDRQARRTMTIPLGIEDATTSVVPRPGGDRPSETRMRSG